MELLLLTAYRRYSKKWKKEQNFVLNNKNTFYSIQTDGRISIFYLLEFDKISIDNYKKLIFIIL